LRIARNLLLILLAVLLLPYLLAPLYRAGHPVSTLMAWRWLKGAPVSRHWIDLAAIYRSRNLASDTGSIYSFIPFRQAKNFNTQEARFSANSRVLLRTFHAERSQPFEWLRDFGAARILNSEL